MKTHLSTNKNILRVHINLLLLLSIIWSSSATAAAEAVEQNTLVPLPSVFDFTHGAGWGGALGLGVEYESAYDGSDEYEVELDPAGTVHWRMGDNLFFFEGVELGWRGRVAPQWLVQGGLRYESGLEPDDSEDGQLDGLPERSSHIVGFIEGRYALDAQWQTWLGGRFMGGESDFGSLGVLAAGYRPSLSGRVRTDGLGLELLLFSTFGDAAFINKDFGVTASDAAASGLRQATLDGGYRSTGITVLYRDNLYRQLQYSLELGVEYYNSEIGDSPIAQKNYEAEISTTVLWVF